MYLLDVCKLQVVATLQGALEQQNTPVVSARCYELEFDCRFEAMQWSGGQLINHIYYQSSQSTGENVMSNKIVTY